MDSVCHGQRARVRLESAPAMAVKQDAIGKEWPGTGFEVEADRIRQYADAVGEESSVHQDAEAARQAGFRDLVAPPMFCVVYSAPAMGPALLDPELEMNFSAMVHGGQEFEWGEPVCAGDVITTTVRCKDISERNGMGFYVFESTSSNQDGAETVRGTWTNIVRGV
jgi:acyl dehydratase